MISQSNPAWSKVATDLFSYNGDNLVVIVDYNSKLKQASKF